MICIKPNIYGCNKRTWGDKEGVWGLWGGGWGTFSSKCLRASRTSRTLNLEKDLIRKGYQGESTSKEKVKVIKHMFNQ